MSRVLRQQQPGSVFHITSRTQGHEPWFTERLRPVIAGMITDGVTSAGAALIAYAVMPNHVHVILAQGTRSLGWTMQPVFRRIALLVHRSHGLMGHVFERRFRSTSCLDADHIRNAILYTHFNPVRAGLCTAVEEYNWTSHLAYCSDFDHPRGIPLRDVLELFASGVGRTREDLRSDYLAHVEWWHAARHSAATAVSPPPVNPTTTFPRAVATGAPSRPLGAMDLRDRALRILRIIDRGCDLDLVRGSYVGPRAARVRHQLIAALLSAGYRGTAIARFLQISPSAVSRVSIALRWQRATPSCTDPDTPA